MDKQLHNPPPSPFLLYMLMIPEKLTLEPQLVVRMLFTVVLVKVPSPTTYPRNEIGHSKQTNKKLKLVFC